MNILMLHNSYQYSGGEDLSTNAEIQVLREAGHHVDLFTWNNDSIRDMSLSSKALISFRATWNTASIRIVKQRIKELNANLLHVQNFFPLVSPSVHHAARQLGIPTFQHLRNFRLGCLNSYFFRDNVICDDCLGHNPWRGVVRRCYRQSLPASLSVWQMLTVHRLRKTWIKDVDVFITPSNFAAMKLIEVGIPSEKLRVKPNFVSDPLIEGQIIPCQPTIPTFLFIGRISPEKGLLSLLKAWKKVNEPEWKLNIIGHGPELNKLINYCTDNNLQNVFFLGKKNNQEVIQYIKQSSVILVPSRWYETFGRVVIEAYSCGRPVIVSRLGALSELVEEGINGFTVPYSDISAWVHRIQWCGYHQTDLEILGANAREAYLSSYTPQQNYAQLMDIYETVL